MDGDQVDKELEINFKNHLNAAVSIPFFIVASFFIIFILGSTKATFIGLFLWLGINIIPALYLHIEYYIINRGERYLIRYDELVRIKSGQRETYKVSDIDYIEVFMSPAVYRGSNFHFLGIEAYHYAEVHLKSGDKLYITCLLTPKVEKTLRQLRGVQIRRNKRVYNQIG
jgi:hypothetical protein